MGIARVLSWSDWGQGGWKGVPLAEVSSKSDGATKLVSNWYSIQTTEEVLEKISRVVLLESCASNLMHVCLLMFVYCFFFFVCVFGVVDTLLVFSCPSDLSICGRLTCHVHRFVELYRGVGSALLKSTLSLACSQFLSVEMDKNGDAFYCWAGCFQKLERGVWVMFGKMMDRPGFGLSCASEAKCSSVHGEGSGWGWRGKDLQIKCRGALHVLSRLDFQWLTCWQPSPWFDGEIPYSYLMCYPFFIIFLEKSW